MQRSALFLLRSLGSRLRVQNDEAMLRAPKFARELNPEFAQYDPEPQPESVCSPSSEQDGLSGGIGERSQEQSPGTSYNLPHLRADVEQQRYPVSAIHALVHKRPLTTCQHSSTLLHCASINREIRQLLSVSLCTRYLAYCPQKWPGFRKLTSCLTHVFSEAERLA
jgi:hypothetical protein